MAVLLIPITRHRCIVEPLVADALLSCTKEYIQNGYGRVLVAVDIKISIWAIFHRSLTFQVGELRSTSQCVCAGFLCFLCFLRVLCEICRQQYAATALVLHVTLSRHMKRVRAVCVAASVRFVWAVKDSLEKGHELVLSALAMSWLLLLSFFDPCRTHQCSITTRS